MKQAYDSRWALCFRLKRDAMARPHIGAQGCATAPLHTARYHEATMRQASHVTWTAHASLRMSGHLAAYKFITLVNMRARAGLGTGWVTETPGVSTKCSTALFNSAPGQEAVILEVADCMIGDAVAPGAAQLLEGRLNNVLHSAVAPCLLAALPLCLDVHLDVAHLQHPDQLALIRLCEHC